MKQAKNIKPDKTNNAYD